MVTRQIRVSGRVQGVGYRDALRTEAMRAGVSGWARVAHLEAGAPALEFDRAYSRFERWPDL